MQIELRQFFRRGCRLVGMIWSIGSEFALLSLLVIVLNLTSIHDLDTGSLNLNNIASCNYGVQF